MSEQGFSSHAAKLGPDLRVLVYTVLILALLVALALIPVRNWAVLPVNSGRASPIQLPLQSIVKLDGSWAFYPGVLVDPQEGADSILAGAEFLAVPGSWTSRMPAFGLASYVCILPVQPETVLPFLELYTINAGTAYRLWVNGELLGESGSIGQPYKPHAEPRSFRFAPKPGDNVIVFQVANQVHPRAGLWESILLAPDGVLSTRHEKNASFDLAIFGGIMFLALFVLVFYLLFPMDPGYLAFAGSAVFLALGNVVRSAFVVYRFIPQIDFMVLKRAQFALYYLAAGAFAMTWVQGTSRFRKWLCLGFVLLSSLMALQMSFGSFARGYSMAVLFYPSLALVLAVMIMGTFLPPPGPAARTDQGLGAIPGADVWGLS
jgi:hypothetical protein